MKKILLVLVALVVLAVVGVMILLSNLGSIIRSAVETFGSEATQTQVTLQSADISLSSGEGALKGLVIANPEGFATPNAFELGNISVKVDTSTVTSDTIVIREIVIEAPQVTYELSNSLTSNLGKIQENVDAYTKRITGGGGEDTTAKEPESGGKKMIIESLRVRNGTVSLAATIAGGGVKASIAEIHLQDIGKKSGGATAAEVTSKVLEALVNGALTAVADSGISKAAKDALSGDTKALEGAVEDILGGLKKKK